MFEAAEKFKTLEVTITGGEPTMWPGLIPALEAAQHLKFANLQLITNAYRVPPLVQHAISTSNLSRICVSLDGVAEVHDTNRGEGAYDRTIRGIYELLQVHDNITVISVVDASNHTRWPELTAILLDLGVSQHHLAPVCFAGHAMADYKGLSAEQFEEVRATVEQMHQQLPTGFRLRFNDTLIRAPRSRTMSLYQLSETWKGWHVVVRPDGDVRSAVRAWGRSWRADETLGNLADTDLTAILESRAGIAVPFARNEEVARKFHLGANLPLIVADQADVASAESHALTEPPAATGDSGAGPAAAPTLGVELPRLADAVRRDPRRFRLRAEDGFAMLFDTRSHDVNLLNSEEVWKIGHVLEAVQS